MSVSDVPKDLNRDRGLVGVRREDLTKTHERSAERDDGYGATRSMDLGKSSDVRDQKRADSKARDSLQLQVYALAHQSETGELPARVQLHFDDWRRKYCSQHIDALPQ